MADAPPPEPLTLDEAKAHLRYDLADQDDLIGALIVAAREYVEDYTGLVLTPRTITETAAALGPWIDLASWPVSGVTAIRYPVSGAMTPLAAGSWLMNLNRRPVRLLPASWNWGVGSSYFSYSAVTGLIPGVPTAFPVEIDVVAGYATPDDVPQTIKQAMLLLVQSWFDNRSAVEAGLRAAAIEVPFTVDVLLRRWKLASI